MSDDPILSNQRTPIEVCLETALDEVAKLFPEGEAPAFELQVFFRDGSHLMGAIKRAGDRIYVLGMPAQTPQGRPVEGKIIEAVFHGSDIVRFARLRDVEQRRVVGVERSGSIILPT